MTTWEKLSTQLSTDGYNGHMIELVKIYYDNVGADVVEHALNTYATTQVAPANQYDAVETIAASLTYYSFIKTIIHLAESVISDSTEEFPLNSFFNCEKTNQRLGELKLRLEEIYKIPSDLEAATERLSALKGVSHMYTDDSGRWAGKFMTLMENEHFLKQLPVFDHSNGSIDSSCVKILFSWFYERYQRSFVNAILYPQKAIIGINQNTSDTGTLNASGHTSVTIAEETTNPPAAEKIKWTIVEEYKKRVGRLAQVTFVLFHIAIALALVYITCQVIVLATKTKTDVPYPLKKSLDIMFACAAAVFGVVYLITNILVGGVNAVKDSTFTYGLAVFTIGGVFLVIGA